MLFFKVNHFHTQITKSVYLDPTRGIITKASSQKLYPKFDFLIIKYYKAKACIGLFNKKIYQALFQFEAYLSMVRTIISKLSFA